MRNFIDSYLDNPSAATSEAYKSLETNDFGQGYDDEMIYGEIASPEFQLYLEILFSKDVEDANFVSVA